MSADGQRVLWFDPLPRFNVWDASLNGTFYTSATVSSAILSPTGTRVVYQVPSLKQLAIYDFSGHTNLFTCTNVVPIKSASPWSADGRFVAFVTSAPLVPDDHNGANDVYLCDLQTGMLTLISANSNWTASASGISDLPSVSSDARLIAFRSFAPDVVAGVTNAPGLFLFDRMAGLNTVLATGSAGSWTFWVSQPVISSNDTSVIFQSWDSGVTDGDFNRVQDVFAASENYLVVDSDGDGIPDWWMLKYFGHPTGQAGDLSLAQDDADGDGMSNLQEYLAGTDPTNPSSVLAVHISPPSVAGNAATLTWPAVPGRSYQVQSTDNLDNPVWQTYSGSVVVIGSQGSITVAATQAALFYRVVCVN